MNQLRRRAGTAPSNFPTQLAADDSELAQKLTATPTSWTFLT